MAVEQARSLLMHMLVVGPRWEWQGGGQHASLPGSRVLY